VIARAFAIALGIAFACTACSGGDAVHSDAGVAPEHSLAVDAPPPAKVELATPPALEMQPVDAPIAGAPPAKITFEIPPYGAFEVVTWDEAARRAEARLTRENAQAELRRVRQDVLGRRR